MTPCQAAFLYASDAIAKQDPEQARETWREITANAGSTLGVWPVGRSWGSPAAAASATGYHLSGTSLGSGRAPMDHQMPDAGAACRGTGVTQKRPSDPAAPACPHPKVYLACTFIALGPPNRIM